jgi:outer membrane protein OmpA-like peptidoglycan-associated protein
MKVCKTFCRIALACAILPSSIQLPAQPGAAAPAEINLLSWGAGAVVVEAPISYSKTGQWAPESLLDELPETGWATQNGDLTPKVFVFELAGKSQITSLAFDSAHVEKPGRAAKDLKVEIADSKTGPFSPVASFTLAQAQDHQKFALKTPAEGRYLRLTVLTNWGDPQYNELMNIYAYGKLLVKLPLPDNSGTFSSSYGNFRMAQTGSAVSGCYEHSNGLIENGGFDGRVLRFTWTEGELPPGPRHGGPAMLIFADDGKSFTGYWWSEGSRGAPSGGWQGERIATEVGSCPHWKPGAGNGVVEQLKSEGRATLYGILFDTDSDHLKPESKPTLDALVAAAAAQPTWGFEIDGHTDNVGGDAHNLTLSEKRAQSVKAYLVAAGVSTGRLTTQGFGASKPVSSNDTELGRSQNRRVEVVKK